jgi:hypothetical protein
MAPNNPTDDKPSNKMQHLQNVFNSMSEMIGMLKGEQNDDPWSLASVDTEHHAGFIDIGDLNG